MSGFFDILAPLYYAKRYLWQKFTVHKHYLQKLRKEKLILASGALSFFAWFHVQGWLLSCSSRRTLGMNIVTSMGRKIPYLILSWKEGPLNFPFKDNLRIFQCKGTFHRKSISSFNYRYMKGLLHSFLGKWRPLGWVSSFLEIFFVFIIFHF